MDNHNQTSPVIDKPTYRRHLHQYIVGFILSVVLTLAAYWFTVSGAVVSWMLFISLSVMALLQFGIQLWFFLHMRDEDEPRWKLLVFNLAMVLLTIFIIGTLWIMQNLDYNMMQRDTSKEYNEYIIEDEGFSR